MAWVAARPGDGLVGVAGGGAASGHAGQLVEMLMMVIYGSLAAPDGVSGSVDIPDPLGEQAAAIFADELAAHRVPSVRVIRAQLHGGRACRGMI